MKKLHPFFAIGTIGTAVTAFVQLLLVAFGYEGTHTGFFALYPSLFTFMILGIVQTVKKTKNA